MLLFLAGVCSCTHKEIVCPGGEMKQITVWFDWAKAPAASPEGMTLYFYPTFHGGKIWRYDIAGAEEGKVELPTGSYFMVSCNNDLPDIRLVGTESIDSLAATVSKTSADGLFASTGMLYGANVSELEISPCGVAYRSDSGVMKKCGKSIVKCYPDSLATEYIVEVRQIEGAERLRSASVRLNGVSPGMYLYSGQAVDRPGRLSFGLELSSDTPRLCGSGCAFRQGDSFPTALDMVIIRNDGKSFSHRFDGTQITVNHIGAHRVLIVIDSIKVPETESPGEDVGGIDADVDGWHAIEVDINITIPFAA